MKKILVVDDEAIVRDMMAEILGSDEIQVDTAQNGIEALKRLSAKDISLVVTDIVMAGENGIDLIMKMKTDHPGIPIVAVSGGGGIEGRFDYLEIAKLVGANQILKKPFSAQSLRAVVELTMA